MERDAVDNVDGGNISQEEAQALNATILEYYKKFGRKRDLEQYFSLSTAQGEVKDPSGLFWRRMKEQFESSDSGDKSRESSLEVCRISIKCSVPDPEPCSSQDEHQKIKSDTESPPIIVEEPPSSRHSDDESVKSDDNHSQKSMDATLDTSINKALSPSSSINSQRKLEWDSLADVGYANESDKRTSASSLSTLERLALKQQYSNNDTKDSLVGPTAHSTPIEETDPKPKSKKGSKITKIYTKDVDFVEVNVPQSSENPSQSVNVNLTKHISFNVDKGGAVSVDNVKKDMSVTPEKVAVETEMTIQGKKDKEIQTSLIKTKEKSSSSADVPSNQPVYAQGIPVLINLNTLRRKHKRRKLRVVKKKLRSKSQDADKENVPVLEKSGEQVSDAESFEYMPGHIYNQNQLNQEANKPSTSNQSNHTSGNKSSLESSAPTTDSSKGSRHSFTKDLEKSIKLLQSALHKRYNDSDLKNKLIKQIVQRLLTSNYRDDETTTDFLSGLSFSSKKLGLGEGNTTTSTSDANNTTEKAARPKKSILRIDKFNANVLASTSQSAPNLPSVSHSEKPVASKLTKVLTTSNTESDVSSKEKTSSDTAFAKTSSEELYQKYLSALRREEAYKRHLRDKEMFLKQKLVASDTAFNIPTRVDPKSQLRLKELIKDLTRNNYDDGSGDASKLEGGLNSNNGVRYRTGRSQRSHSVFTLSSSPNSERKKRSDMKKSEANNANAGHSNKGNHYCCCPHHYSNKFEVSDSSVQVNLKTEDKTETQNHNVGTCCKPRSVKSGSRPGTAPVLDNIANLKTPCTCNKIVETCNLEEACVSKYPQNNKKVVSSGCSCNIPESSIQQCDLKMSDDESNEMCKLSKCSQTNLRVDYASHTHDVKNTACLHEAIRCIQTNISIDPKISDPALDDINFVKNCDCVKLIQEHYRQVSKSTIDSETNLQKKCSEDILDQHTACCSNEKGKDIHEKNTRKKIQKVDVEVQSDLERPRSAREKIEGNFTIPIQGTNMTLKVSVGGSNPPIARTDNAVLTDAINTLEDATSVTEECSKGVQSQNDVIFSQHSGRPDNFMIFDKQDSKRTINAPRPFLRANTYAGITDKGISDVQNDLLDQYHLSKNQVITSSSDERQLQRPKQYYESNTYPHYLDSREDKRDFSPIYHKEIEHNRNNAADADRHIIYSESRQQSFVPFIDMRIPRTSSQNVTPRDARTGVTDTVRDQTNSRSSPCPCPVPSNCGNTCTKDAYCRMPTNQSVGFDDDRKVILENRSYTVAQPSTFNLQYRTASIQSNEDYIANDGRNTIHDGQVPARYEPQTSGYSSERIQRATPAILASSVTYPLQKNASIYGNTANKALSANNPTAAIRFMPHLIQDSKSYIVDPKNMYKKNLESDLHDGGVVIKTINKLNEKGDQTDSGNDVYDDDKSENEDFESEKYLQSGPPHISPREILERQFIGQSPLLRERTLKDSGTQVETYEKESDYQIRTKLKGRKEMEINKQSKTSKPDATRQRIELAQQNTNDVYTRPVPTQCSQPTSPIKSPRCLDCIPGSREYVESPRSSSPGRQTSRSVSPASCRGGGLSPNRRHGSSKESPTGHIEKNTQSFINKGDNVKGTDVHSPRKNKESIFFTTGRKNAKCPPSANCKGSCNDICAKVQSRNEKQIGRTVPVSSTETDSDPRTSNAETSETKENDKTASKTHVSKVIQDIINRYSKKDIQKSQRKKCFKEIITILNYLLETEDTDVDAKKYILAIRESSDNSEIEANTQNEMTTDATPGTEDIAPITKSFKEEISTKKLRSVGSSTNEFDRVSKMEIIESTNKKKLVDKGVQQSEIISKTHPVTESSDIPVSTDMPGTSSDSATCRVLNKIKRECEKYHQKRCKGHQGKKCECSSTSESCEQCNRIHMCSCRPHKCKSHKSRACDKTKKKCVAYNLIIQTSDSMISEEPVFDRNCHPLKNIIVKVPPKKKQGLDSVPYKEVICNQVHYSPRNDGRKQRSRSLPNETGLSSTDDGRIKQTVFTVRDYLEKNRPDFIEQYTKRQNCLKMISESRVPDNCDPCCDPTPCSPRLKSIVIHSPNVNGCPPVYCGGVRMSCDPYNMSDAHNEVTTIDERSAKRELLCMQVQVADSAPVNRLSSSDLRRLARQIGLDMRSKKVTSKLMSEREMKKHSEKIYKTLPEVVRKKEELKKENIKKTNLLMANLFKKNLQKKTLRGTVNLSNYHTVVKI